MASVEPTLTSYNASRQRKTYQGWTPDPTKEYLWIPQSPTVEPPAGFKDSCCPTCYLVSRDLGEFSRDRSTLSPNQERIMQWTIDLGQLTKSAEARCQFCCFLVVKIFGRSSVFVFGSGTKWNDVMCCAASIDGTEKTKQQSRLSSSIAALTNFCEQHPAAGLGLIIEPADFVKEEMKYSRLKFSVRTKKNLNDNGFQELLKLMKNNLWLTLEIYARKGDPAAKFIKTRPANTNTASQESIDQVCSWIKECLHEHPECPRLRNVELPTRVLKLIDGEHVQLYTTSKDELTQYATLSYCWGGPQTFTTTLATIKENTDGFKIAELPQTFQDAIELTRKLGLQYIWIDSFCIIQDSPPDKTKELSKMAEYYKRSYITICAGPKSATEGFLKTQHECQNHPGTGLHNQLLKMPFLGPDASIGTIYFREEDPLLLSFEPISTRAWALQEQLLSPRVLLYGTQLIWQCHTCQHSDGGVEDWSKDKNALDNRKCYLDLRNRSSAKSSQNNPENQLTTAPKDNLGLIKTWYRIVAQFSRRSISFSSDKLPAISALATEIAAQTGDQYLAGHWRSQLLRELMWSTSHKPQPLFPQIWRAPTWSWASVDNTITFGRTPGTSDQPLAEIVSCQIEPLYKENPFGEIKSGVLEIKGPVVEMPREDVKKLLDAKYTMPGPQGFRTGEDWIRHSVNFLPGDGERNNSKDKKWELPENICLLLLWGKSGENSDVGMLSGLGLEEKEGGVYERVGCFTTLPMSPDMVSTIKVVQIV